MRFGLLGPANGDLAGLARCAEFLLNSVRVTRAIYLGDDDALEDTVALWAESLVGPNTSDEGIWERALPVVATGTPDQLDTFVRAERARLRLKSLECLPPEQLRTIEMFGDRVAVLIHDKALLNEDDIYSATFLIYGRSTSPLVKRIGPRWFLTPGPIGCAGGGCAVLDDPGDEVIGTVYDSEGRVFASETMAVRRSPRVNVRR
jgi:hypothetical protein